MYTAYWWQPKKLASIGGASAWMVGAAYEDFVAVDTYAAVPLALSARPKFMGWYNPMLTQGVPMLITEYGQYVVKPGTVPSATSQAQRAKAIAGDAAGISSQDKIKMWLHWGGTGAQGDWSLTDAASQKAWRNIAATSRTS
ncbi:MAG: hypothetical protein M3140_03130 [Actinomycetota bacterium]|nr:hypothetical protein [Actinomycetota bacterium]